MKIISSAVPDDAHTNGLPNCSSDSCPPKT